MAQKTILDIDLLALAKHRTHASIAAIIILFFNIGWLILSANLTNNELAAYFLVGGWIISLLLSIWAIVIVVLLQRTFGAGIVSTVLVAIITLFLNFLVLLVVVSQASTVLKLAGAKVGLISVSESERAKITPGHCRKCGYDRTGLELLQPCPECQRIPQVI